MEIKSELKKPYSDNERMHFIVEQNHKKGYTIEETDNALLAWGKDDEELLLLAKEQKQSENTTKAKLAVENGYVEFKEAEFETNAQTVGDLTATMLMLQGASAISEEEPTYLWLSKDDKVVNLTVSDFVTLGGLIAEYKNRIWQEEYLAYKTAIETAETLEELENIKFEYEQDAIENVEENSETAEETEAEVDNGTEETEETVGENPTTEE